MIATPPRDCFPESEIQDFLAGKMPADRFESVLGHLETCDRCQGIASGKTTPPSGWLAGLNQNSDDEDFFNEPDCLAALYHANHLSLATASTSLPPIETLGVYRLIRPLGRGGMGMVYLAEHERLKRRCAVKLLHHERRHDQSFRDRFDREMHAVASLDHPNLVKASDAGEVDGWSFLVMEYLEGLDLATISKHVGKLDGPIAAAVIAKVCLGLNAMHEAGLVHRDVKPSNIMLTFKGEVKLLDLGLVTESESEDSMRLTTVGHIVGTLLYAAPEQLKNNGVVDGRSDLYSVGCTLYQLLSGHAPFDANQNIASLAIEKTTHKPDSLSVQECGSKELAELVDDLLSLDRDQRPSSAAEVASRLDAIASGVTTAELKRLGRRVSRSAAVSDSSASMPTYPQPFSSIDQGDKTSQPYWAVPKKLLIATALGFFSFLLAGITFYVATDRGVLKIESPRDDLKIDVLRNGKLVEQLNVRLGENETSLRTGTYTIKIAEGGESLALSDDSVTVYRGDEAVLEITETKSLALIPNDDNNQPGEPDRLYKGKPLSYWLGILRVERDVDTLGDTMKAIVALSGPDDAELVHNILILSRRLGGWVIGTDTPSGQFMERLMDYEFCNVLLPNPGIEAISIELADSLSNPQSRAASLMLLSQASSRKMLWNWTRDHRDSADRLYESLVTLPAPEDDRFRNPQDSLVRGIVLELATPLNRDLAEIPWLQTQLLDRYETLTPPHSAKERLGFWFNDHDDSESLPPEWFGKGISPNEVLAGLELKLDVPPALTINALVQALGSDESEQEAKLRELFANDSVTMADEMLAWLASARSNFGGMGGGGFGGGFSSNAPGTQYKINSKAVAQACRSSAGFVTELLPEMAKHTSRPDFCFRLLNMLVKSIDNPKTPVMDPYTGSMIRWSDSSEKIVRKAIEICRSRVDEIPVSPVEVNEEGNVKLPDAADPLYSVASPDFSKVAFVGTADLEEGKRRGVFVYDRRLGTFQQLSDEALKTVPAWSPDSRKIAIGNGAGYVSDYPLVIIDVDTGKVTQTGVEGVGAAWSPDGKSIAATSNVNHGGSWMRGVPMDGQMMIYDLTSGDATYVGPEGKSERSNGEDGSSWLMQGGYFPSWSPSGDQVAWVFATNKKTTVEGDKKKSASAYQVWTSNLDGSDAKMAIDNCSEFIWQETDGTESVVKKPKKKD